jgi:hypothetical protein
MNRWRSPSLARAFAASRVAAESSPAGPSFVAATTGVGAMSAASVTKPAVDVGDVMLLGGILGTDAASPGFSGGITGWTQVGIDAVVTGLTGVVFFRVVDGTEGASFLFRDFNTAAVGVRATLAVYRGVDSASPIGDFVQAEIDPGATSYASGNVTPAAANSMLVQFCFGAAGTSWTPSAGFAERADDGATLAIEAADLAVAATDPVGATATASGAAVGMTFLVALTPAGA